MQEITSTRTNALIDPGLHIWHGEVAGYLFLGGLVAGIMVLTGLSLAARPGDARRTGSAHLALLPWSVPVLLSVGMFFLWLDLENPWNAFRFYFVLRPASPMSWGAWILLAIYPASLALAWITTPPAWRRRAWSRVAARLPEGVPGGRIAALGRWLDAHATQVGWLNVVVGAGLGVYTGLLLGTMASRPLWNSAILGPLFLVSGMSTGAAYMLLFRLTGDERRRLARVDMGLIAVELVLIGVWLVGLLTSGEPRRLAAGTLLGGPWTTAFWSLVVGVGLIVPLATEWMEDRAGHVPGRLAAVLVLLGGFTLRWILVHAGQASGWSEAALAVLH